MDSQHFIFSKLADCKLDIVFPRRKAEVMAIILVIKSILRKEEKLFLKHGFPEIDTSVHTASHNELERSLNLFMDDVDETCVLDDSKFEELEEFLKSWIKYHEQTFDEYAESFIRLSEYAA